MKENLAYSVAEAVRLSGICRTVVYEEIKAGRLRARKLGRRTLILSEDMQRWLANLPLVRSEAA